MPFMLMEPSNQTFRELLANGVHHEVPRFQRDYAWDYEQWEDLWSDIQSIEAEEYHYMGYIVLQRKSQHVFEIIDGQQRMITLSLLMVAAIAKLKGFVEQEKESEKNQDRVDLLTSQFVGTKNTVSLRVDSKLTLNRNNQANFKSICSNFKVTQLRRQSATNLCINKAFEYFMSKPMGDTGEEIARFVERVASGMMFTKIVVHDELNAYKVFETLNARGVQLSTPDLLRNYIFSTVTRDGDVTNEDLDDIDERWNGIVSQLGDASFTDFVRYHHNARSAQVSKKELFRAIRREVSEPKIAYTYLQSLEEQAPVFAALLNPDDEWWRQQDEGKYRSVYAALQGLRLFSIRQPFSLLMAAYFRFSPQEFVKLAKYVLVLSVRYNVVCHLLPHEQESAYSQIALKIQNGEFNRASHVKNSSFFRKLYPNDDTFIRAFDILKMPSRRSSKKIRFLLCEIEAKLGANAEFSQMTLEHVCPYHPNDVWRKSFGEGINDIQDRLGNMVLLETDELGRKSFAEKKTVYTNSGRPLAQKVASYAEWNLSTLQEYQTWLAEKASETWRVDFE